MMTLEHALEDLDGFVEPGGDLRRALNDVLERLWDAGIWPDLTLPAYYTAPAEGGLVEVYLPPETETILAVAASGSSVSVRDLWFRYTALKGMDPLAVLSGAQDCGHQPSTQPIDPDDPLVTLNVMTDAGVSYVPDDETNPAVRVSGLSDDGHVVKGTFTYDGVDGAVITFNPAIVSIESIIYNHQDEGKLLLKDPDDKVHAAILPGRGVCRFRKYLFGGLGPGTVVSLLLKRKFTPLLHSDDFVYISSLPALKHALLGRVAENNSDLERAEYHWNKAQAILEADKDAYRGAARPVVNLQPFGEGIPPIPNIQ